MTREDRLIVSLDEIAAIRWECPQCRVAVSFHLDESIRLPRQCPACHHDAYDPDARSEDRIAEHFVQALKGMLRFQREHARPVGTLALEFLGERRRSDPRSS